MTKPMTRDEVRVEFLRILSEFPKSITLVTPNLRPSSVIHLKHKSIDNQCYCGLSHHMNYFKLGVGEAVNEIMRGKVYCMKCVIKCMKTTSGRLSVPIDSKPLYL